MNNVIDEVLSGNPKYNIYDSSNNLVYSNAKIELATPVVTVGTALNKALFDSINSQINLSAIYNTPTIVSSQSVTTGAYIPAFTYSTTPTGFSVSAGGYYGSGYQTYRVVDGDTSTQWRNDTDEPTSKNYWQIGLDASIQIATVSITLPRIKSNTKLYIT